MTALPLLAAASRASTSATFAARGGEKTLRRLLQEKVLVAFAAPFVLAAPYAAAVGRLPSPLLLACSRVAGFFLPDLLLRHEIKQRREQLFLDLPELISVLALALGAGQSLRRALELAARDCEGPLAVELERALSLARRHQNLSEREALVQVARESGRADLHPLRRAAGGEGEPLPRLPPPAGPRDASRAGPLSRAGGRARLPGDARARSRRSSPCSCCCSRTGSCTSSPKPPNALKGGNEMLLDAIWNRLLNRLLREERGDGIISWVVLAVGLAAAAAAVIALLRPAITSAAQSIVNLISGG